MSSLKCIIKGIIKKARRKKLVAYTSDINFEDLDISLKKKIIDNEAQVFSKSDLKKMLEYLIEHPDLHNLCILLMLVSGIRVGELVTIEFGDFVTDTCIEIKRTETRYRLDGHYHFDRKSDEMKQEKINNIVDFKIV